MMAYCMICTGLLQYFFNFNFTRLYNKHFTAPHFKHIRVSNEFSVIRCSNVFKYKRALGASKGEVSDYKDKTR